MVYIMDSDINMHTPISFYEQLQESVSTIAITQNNQYIRTVLYSLKIDKLRAGDFMIISAEYEVTNNHGVNVMIASKIILSDSPTSSEGILVDQANGFNVTAGNHHGLITKSRSYRVKEDMQDVYLNLVAWSASTAVKPGALLKIEQRYGHLDAIIIPAND